MAREEAEQAAAATMAAEERAGAAEQRAAEFAAARAAAGDGGGIDARLLWTLEQARSERTWRHSVAPGPDSVSVFTDASDPLYEALQVELDAAREEVGAVVELEADLPPGVTPAGSVLALRAAQELLANVVRRGEVTTLHVHAEGVDLVVAVRSVDEEGEPVPTEPLAIPTSADIEQVADGVRILGAVRPADGSAATTAQRTSRTRIRRRPGRRPTARPGRSSARRPRPTDGAGGRRRRSSRRR